LRKGLVSKLPGKFADCFSMTHRDWMKTDERFVIQIKQRPLGSDAIDRIWPIENDNFCVRFLASAHAEIHCPDKGVATRPDVLQINEQDIEVFQHVRSRLAMFAVQTMNRNVKTRMLITSPFYHVVLRLAEKPMLRAEER
jgi:hypothetical protein